MATQTHSTSSCRLILLLAILIIPAASLLSGCAISRGMAVGAMKPILVGASDEILKSGDLQTVGEGLPAQILTLKGLAAGRPGDAGLAALAVQLHLFYAMGFVEGTDPAHAEILYKEGRDIGLRTFSRDATFAEALRGGDLELKKALSGVGRDKAELMLWTSACWAGWIGLNLNDPEAIADLTLVEAMLDRTLELAPGTFHAMPLILRGAIYSMRPPILGGDPEKAREAFDEAFRMNERQFLLTQVYFASTYCKQVFDRDLFEKSLREVIAASPDILPEVRLLNLLAKQQAEIWLARADDIF
ncbi:MAG: TRAP transporter TatT component family protein [Candidatus Eisenbacteria bacterium]|uniref:TRAP transporter TatT component family protein n=1 Tax=Eiseniibacteriota bacterium TaxID=2212470 RepID=A0A948RTZ6_UNCEI|nr:TRAP transporter TatT component family protein [Candidatus Eisenbacteria bacterium]MBU1948668.1 TRAP transporter TatT component family protein [Candidatus Eisenbacteria bacterium]MBU2690978.1 TRAP transporter TatT component family protein [Candidatus Eisenbacteria bacterium]